MKKNIICRVSETAFRKLQKMKEEKGFADRDWGEFLTFLSKDVSLKPTEGEMISQATKENLLGLWMSNFAENLPHIRESKTLDKLVPKNAKNPPVSAAIVVGAGPSIYQYRHLEMLAESNFEGKVISTDSMLHKCLERGIVPDLTVTVDGGEIIAKFYEHELVEKHGSELKVALISTACPKIRERLERVGAEIYWFHGIFDDWRSPESFTKMLKLVTKTEDKPYGIASVSALGNCGACAWVLAHSLLRSSPIALLGIDMGYPEGYPLSKTYYFSTYLKAAGGDAAKAIAFGYREVFNPFTKQKVVQDPVFRHYTIAWVEAARQTEPWVVTVNCSPTSALFSHDETINFASFEDFLRCYKDVERLKERFLKAD